MTDLQKLLQAVVNLVSALYENQFEKRSLPVIVTGSSYEELEIFCKQLMLDCKDNALFYLFKRSVHVLKNVKTEVDLKQKFTKKKEEQIANSLTELLQFYYQLNTLQAGQHFTVRGGQPFSLNEEELRLLQDQIIRPLQLNSLRKAQKIVADSIAAHTIGTSVLKNPTEKTELEVLKEQIAFLRWQVAESRQKIAELHQALNIYQHSELYDPEDSGDEKKYEKPFSNRARTGTKPTSDLDLPPSSKRHSSNTQTLFYAQKRKSQSCASLPATESGQQSKRTK